jgi:hypothetical protein
MGDGDMEKREMFFKNKKKRRERQVKEKKKLLDGSDSEGNEDSEDGREDTQAGAYDSLTLLGSTSCAPLTQIKGTPDTDQIERELNKIELNNTTNSPLKNENINQTDSSEQQVSAFN